MVIIEISLTLSYVSMQMQTLSAEKLDNAL